MVYCILPYPHEGACAFDAPPTASTGTPAPHGPVSERFMRHHYGASGLPQWMILPENSAYPDFEEVHAKDDWCVKAGCRPCCRCEDNNQHGERCGLIKGHKADHHFAQTEPAPAPPEPGSAEQFKTVTDHRFIAQECHESGCQFLVLRAQLQEREQERDAARLDAEDKARLARIQTANFEASEATIQRLAPYLRHYPDCEWPSPRGCTCGLKQAYEAALAHPEAGKEK